MIRIVLFALATITQAELVHRSQQLVDAIAAGDTAPWKKYYADDALFFDEKGRSMTKAQLIDDLRPLPKGYSGTIHVVHPQSRIIGNTAILSYDLDETETVWGQNLTARYHTTDTWMLRNGKWQIVASQTLRYYEDPAPGRADPAHYADYAGTYELAPGLTMKVTVEDGKLYAQREGRAKEELIPEEGNVFFRKGVEGRRIFRDGVLIDRRNNEDIVWRKINSSAAAAPSP
jgi:ketosteroid isomerase-like protein